MVSPSRSTSVAEQKGVEAIFRPRKELRGDMTQVCVSEAKKKCNYVWSLSVKNKAPRGKVGWPERGKGFFFILRRLRRR